MENYDYSKIPLAYYDEILKGKKGMRRFWHFHKFDSVKRAINLENTNSLLDVGCFSGSFLGNFFSDYHGYKLGVDILKNEIEFAKMQYGQENLDFLFISDFNDFYKIKRIFNTVTFVEVIEHLTWDTIKSFFENIERVTQKGSEIIITTPNYFSLWPILEIILNKVSSIKYEEQHITKFNYFNIEEKLQKIVPSFKTKYEVVSKTTSHFITPFLSILNYDFAIKLSRAINYRRWRNAFGSMIILKIKRIN